jgi:hypothetical protein
MSSFLMMLPIFSTICATMKNQEIKDKVVSALPWIALLKILERKQIARSVNILLVTCIYRNTDLKKKLSILAAQSWQRAKLFLQSSELGLPHPLSRSGECVPPPFDPGGGGGRAHSLTGEGVGGVPIPTRGHTLWCSIFISTL